MYIKLDKDYEVKTTLGTIRDIEKIFKKSFIETISNVANMNVEEQIKLLFVGVKKANPEITQEQFSGLCDAHIGFADIMEYLEEYFYALQYPGLTETEVQEKIAKKLQRSMALQQKIVE